MINWMAEKETIFWTVAWPMTTRETINFLVAAAMIYYKVALVDVIDGGEGYDVLELFLDLLRIGL